MFSWLILITGSTLGYKYFWDLRLLLIFIAEPCWVLLSIFEYCWALLGVCLSLLELLTVFPWSFLWSSKKFFKKLGRLTTWVSWVSFIWKDNFWNPLPYQNFSRKIPKSFIKKLWDNYFELCSSFFFKANLNSNFISQSYITLAFVLALDNLFRTNNCCEIHEMKTYKDLAGSYMNI